MPKEIHKEIELITSYLNDKEKDKVFSCYKRLYELLIDGNYIEIIKETIDLRNV